MQEGQEDVHWGVQSLAADLNNNNDHVASDSNNINKK